MTTVRPLVEGDFDAFHATYEAAYSRDFDTPWLAAEKRVNLTADAYNDTIALVARDGDVVVGGATAILPLQDNRQFAFLEVFVHPNNQRAGHGSALMDELLERVRADGRTIGFGQPMWGVDEQTSPARDFAESYGFELDMLDAIRVLPLPADLPAPVVADGYTLQTWRGPCPDDLLDEYADLRHLLVAEAPKGEAGIEPEHWDAARVRKDEADLAEVGRVMQVVVARAPGGELAGHTQLAFPACADVYQWDTLVRPAHRGHGLGLALKTAMMHATADLLEGRDRVYTENAASNAHMIAVNEALGYRQVAWAGEYVRTL